jgi:hypothetical protein
VDDEDDDMDMEEGGGGSSSVPVAIRFPSNGDTFVNRMGANDAEVRLFTADQKEEMELYIQSLSRPPAASSSGAAGGSASGFKTAIEQTLEQQLEETYEALDLALETARMYEAKCKTLNAENAALEKKVKHSKSMEAMVVSACVCIH